MSQVVKNMLTSKPKIIELLCANNVAKNAICNIFCSFRFMQFETLVTQAIELIVIRIYQIKQGIKKTMKY